MISALAHAGFALDERALRRRCCARGACSSRRTSCVTDACCARGATERRTCSPTRTTTRSSRRRVSISTRRRSTSVGWNARSTGRTSSSSSSGITRDGGLFYTGKDAEALVATSKHPIGGAEPSANGVAALTFARLAVMCGRDDLGDKGRRDPANRSRESPSERRGRSVPSCSRAPGARPRRASSASPATVTATTRVRCSRSSGRACLPLTVRAVVASDTPLVPWMAERPRNRGRGDGVPLRSDDLSAPDERSDGARRAPR